MNKEMYNAILKQLNDSIGNDPISTTLKIYDDLSYRALDNNHEELFTDLIFTLVSYLVDYDFTTELIRYIVRSMAIYENKGWHKNSLAYLSIEATLYYTLHDYDSSIVVLKKIAKRQLKQNKTIDVAASYGNIGYIYSITGKPNEALDILTDTLMIFDENNIKNSEGKMKNFLAIISAYLELNELDKAKKYMNTILNWREIDSYNSIKQELYTHFAKYYVKSKDFDKALLHYYEAIELAELSAPTKSLLKLYNDTINVLEQLDNCSEFMLIHEKIVKVTDELFERNNQSNYRLFKNELDYVHKTFITQEMMQFDNQSDYDTLTCAYNRDYLSHYIEHLLYAASSENMPFSLLLIDIDDFSKINEKYGHYIGDLLLQSLALRLHKDLSSEHQLIRYSGDRFLVTMANTNKKEALTDSRHYLKLLSEAPYNINQHTIHVKGSGGLIESLDSKARDLKDLLRLCDLVLFQAKKSGKNQLIQW